VAALVVVAAGPALAADANRLAYLDRADPYYVGLSFPKLITPQWVGEPGVEAVVVLAIDDMRDPQPWEAYLRPILTRLQQIDGRAPTSIMTCRVDPLDPHLQRWLQEGLSIETHTADHPCPLLANGDFAAAKSTYDRCVDQMCAIPGSRPVAFRTPCCDSLNTPSPRFFSEIFNRTTPAGNFLFIDSSVFVLFTSNDPQLPRALVQDADGTERLGKYVPAERRFVNFVEDYPYPYVVGRLCWEFPCVVPSDWEAQHLHQPANPRTVADMQAALDLTVIKQGVFNLVFHPYGWIRAEQVVELVDHAVSRHGGRVKFLTFREAHDRLVKHLLAGQALRDAQGGDNGVRLLDLNGDGFQDVVIGNEALRLMRIWQPQEGAWAERSFPARLVRRGPGGESLSTSAVWGIVGPEQRVTLLVRDEVEQGAWQLIEGEWVEQPALWRGLEWEGQPLATARHGVDQGLRLRDLDGDGQCELLCANPRVQAVFRWIADRQTWERLPWSLPEQAAAVDAQGRDAGLRLQDVDEDGTLDLLFADEHRYLLYLFEDMDRGWSRKVLAGRAGDERSFPPFVVDGQNYGGWIADRHIWYQNETTHRLPHLVDVRSFNELLADLPPAPRSPEASRRAFRARPGFRVELAAAEPLVVDPVAFAWGPDGRLWVAEMHDYPLGVVGQPAGRIRVLYDDDGDYRYDRAELFLDGVRYPNGVMPWRHGVLITSAPDVLFAADTDRDGRADEVRPLFTGFGQGNQQHRVNGLQWGLDNWVYCANGDSGGEVESLLTGQRVNISGRDVRIRPDEGLLDPQTGQTQFLRSRDDWGNWFGCNNANPMYHFVLDDAMLRRNPHLAVERLRVDVPEVPGTAPVYPISRTQARFNDPHTLNRFTSACSAMVYREELFGQAFIGNSFVSEPVHNLVHREVLAPQGVTFTSRRARDEHEREFLASSDNWFRPTMLRTGPDGALWIADMYRLIIEHPEYIPAELHQQLDLRAGSDRGRIWRVLPVHQTPRPFPRLDRMNAVELAAALDSPNGWQRDMAQQLLVERGELAAVPELEKMVREAARPQARLHALCTLDGLKALSNRVIEQALADAHPGVRRHAVRLAAPRLNDTPELARKVIGLADDGDLHVVLQVAYALGECTDPQAAAALARLMMRHAQDPFLSAAALSSLSQRNLADVLAAVLEAGEQAAGVLPQLLEQAAAMADRQAVQRSLALVTATADGHLARWQLEALASLWNVLQRRADASGSLLADLPEALRHSFADAAEQARRIALDPEADEPLRLAAVRTLGLAVQRAEQVQEVLTALLSPQTPLAVQLAAVEAAADLPDTAPAEALIAGWRTYGPELRARVLDVLMRRERSIDALLDALADGRLAPTELGALHRQQLLSHADARLRDRAAELLEATPDRDRQAVIARYAEALSLTADRPRGQEVFRQRCSSCHRLADMGHAVGPDLAGLTDRSPLAMLVAILDPNRAVETRFQSYTAVTASGQVFTGLLANETGNSITLLAADGKQTTLLRSELDVLEGTARSLMPEGIEKDISLQEMADLLAYLTSFRPPRRTFEGNRPELVRPEALRGELWLLASQAEIYGTTLVFEPAFRNLGYWGSADDHAVWSLEIVEQATYRVTLDFACHDGTAGNVFVLSVGGQQLEGRVPGTGTWETYQQVDVGEVTLPPGRYELVLRPAAAPAGYLMDLRGIRLRPLRGKP
jgi:putative membrane-bound dehydrogenase-like protein